jgi:carbon storage regulator
MLILRRRAGESLLIGDDIEIEVLETGAWGVKVGIRAPKAISILRKELQMTRAANCAAARDVRIADLAKSLRLT